MSTADATMDTTPAKLLRSRATGMADRVAAMEQIGAGPLSKMVRIALSDPDEYLYPYRIEHAGRTYDGEEILLLADRLGLQG